LIIPLLLVTYSNEYWKTGVSHLNFRLLYASDFEKVYCNHQQINLDW